MKNNNFQKEIERIKSVYKIYDNSKNYKDLYLPCGGRYSYIFFSLFKRLNFFFIKQNIKTLEKKKILDIGCGFGNNFIKFYQFGAKPENIFGVDLLFYRLKEVKKKFNIKNLINCNCANIPFKNREFDIVTQFVVFSSILDDNMCKNIAAEMLRVLKDDGIIIWYDSYGGNMMSEHTRSYSEKQIKEFFPDCKYEFKRIIPHSQLTFRLGKYEFG